MMHDPFQNYATLGSYYGMQTPLGLPYGGLQASGINPINQSSINPLGGLINPLAGISQIGQPLYGQSPFGPQQLQQQQLQQQQLQQHQLQQLQLAQALAANPAIHQLLASVLNNQLISAGLHPAALGAYGQQFGLQQQSPFGLQGQIGPQFPQFGQIGSQLGHLGSQLAPQSWIGQVPFAGGQGFGAIHPLQALLTARQFQPQGFTPWGY